MEVTLVIDVSGSMRNKIESTTAGVKEIAEGNPDARFNLVEFGSKEGVEVIYKRKKAKKLKKYEARAEWGTPMWDGIGEALSLINPKEKNMIVIITDGEENQSSIWDAVHIKPLIKAIKAADNEFIFMGADVEALEVAKDMGFNRRLHYANTVDGNASAFSFTSTAARYYHANDMVDADALSDIAVDTDSYNLVFEGEDED